MDPGDAAPGRRVDRFPRTRGDGPRDGDGRRVLQPFPPHARGWTVRARCASVRTEVSPARAGMDLQSSRGPSCGPCFPRTRGDGPPLNGGSGLRRWFPPHARGWTPTNRPRRVTPSVSPARAGMDPMPTYRARINPSFPRTRGDGPAPLGTQPDAVRFPPHARGWTTLHPPAL